MYTKTFGPWSIWLFAVGAFCILYSSSIAGLAAGARFLPDYLIELGFVRRGNLKVRLSMIRWYGLVVPFISLLLYISFQRPVMMVTIAACYAAMMLPIQSGITIYLQHKRLPAKVQPRKIAQYFLILTFLLQSALALAVIYFTLL